MKGEGFSLKQNIGAMLFDLPRLFYSLRATSANAWIFMCNRNERLLPDARRIGVRCDWQWTSDLHVAKVFPWTGRRLMQRALADYPIALTATSEYAVANPGITFIVGHRGMGRLPHLLLTLSAIAGQKDASIECIVVEQSVAPEIKDHLPAWVRYIHTPISDSTMAYNRSWAFNVGARLARGSVLVLHDNDMLVPAAYAAEILARVNEGNEVVNLKRFIFFLTERHTQNLFASEWDLFVQPPEKVMQNAEGGGSIAITRDAYFAIGGFDEEFVGWGGEDNEFWERAQSCRVWPYVYLPIIHLWHAPQPGKSGGTRSTAFLYEKRSAIPVADRITKLLSRPFGQPVLSQGS